MNDKPIALDPFCCQGGTTRGLQDAGFYVIGIDIEDQPRYCGDQFYRGDAIAWLSVHREWIRENVALICPSPPCQRYSRTQKIRQREHPDLIGPTRDVLRDIGVPYVIENVEEARGELIDPITLCGAMFGMRTYRHRLFEASFPLTAPEHPAHTAPLTKMGRPRRPGEFAHYVGNFSGVDDAREDMGMHWATRDGLREAIPPAYARYVAEAFLAHTRAMAVA